MGLRDIVDRLDSWVNVALGFGGVSDKIKATRYGGIVERLEDGQLTAMYRTEHLSAKIVDVYPKESLREGFELGGYEISEDPADDTEDNVCAYLRAWKIISVVRTASIWGRLYGGSAIWLGSTSQDPAEPFKLGEQIDFLRVVDRRYLHARPWSLDVLGNPTLYDVIPHEGAGIVGPIHVSRLVMFPGQLTDVRTRQGNAYWDDSVLQRPYDALKSDGLVWRSAEQLISEASVGVLSIKGLYGKITGPARKQIEERLALFNLTRSVARNMTLDLESEKYDRINTSFAGVPDLTDRSIKRVASAADMPVTLLLGEAPAGLSATGESDMRYFWVRVHAYRTQDLEDPIVYLCKAVLAQSGIGGVEVEKLTLKWPALWTPSALELADIYNKTAVADVAYIDRGVVDSSEVALSRFGSDGYSQQTTIDRTLRLPPSAEDLAAAAAGATGGTGPTDGATGGTGPSGVPAGGAPSGENIQAQVLNGTQVASLVDIVAQVSAKTIPRDAGIQIIMLAYQVDEEKAKALIGTAGAGFEAPKPEPTGFGGGGAPFGGKPPASGDKTPAPADAPPDGKSGPQGQGAKKSTTSKGE